MSRSRATKRAIDSTYKKFGQIMQYNGREILFMTDSDITFQSYEHGLQKLVKVRTWELNLTDHQLNELSFKAHTVGIGRNMYRIISFEFHGNDREEIILVLEGKQYAK
jgi:hypothetical protein